MRISNSNSNEAIPQQKMPYKDKKKEAERQKKLIQIKKNKRMDALLQFVEKENPRLLQRFDDQYVEEDDDLDQAPEAALDEVLQEASINPREEVPSPVPDVGELMASLASMVWSGFYFVNHLEDPQDQYVEEDQAPEAALDEVLQEPPVNPLEEVPSPVADVDELMASLDWNNFYFLDQIDFNDF